MIIKIRRRRNLTLDDVRVNALEATEADAVKIYRNKIAFFRRVLPFFPKTTTKSAKLPTFKFN
ncbi:hypothetical protein FD51_GL000702 [Lacticaseibacillus zeae DSM 20178 = KCTC 3804]|uniref:Uncharacterized protein n=1 Tax=Lacticaseibacillus zeae DSM 20178 = KCTC 3804 TaxID=1423816 RepID=A0A0R1ERH2_LACZE|nr:hypothetical protein FD51_GL000702 [Lacticaseibacillus zeae DSM 20178 = KCTC 3804]OLS07696.1 hypothetical protein AUQ39_08655 [Lacticaseibacillus casei]